MKALVSFVLVSTLSFAASAVTLNVVSTRSQAKMQPVLDLFKKENPGVEFAWVKGANWDLIAELEKIGAEGKADIYLTKDLTYMNEAAEKGLLAKIKSEVVRKNIPAFMIDPDTQWVGLALRSRTIAYNPSLVSAEELGTYEDLATPEWQTRMCLRTSLSCYSVAFTASLIHHGGEAKALETLKGWVDNTAIDPTIGDELLLQSIDAGICGAGVLNTHYFVQQLKANPKMNVKMFFANQNTTGAHMNGSGIAILKTSKNQEIATKFVEFMTRTDVQTMFAVQDMEYPGNPEAQTPKELKALGSFKRDETSWFEIGKYLKKARELFIEADYK